MLYGVPIIEGGEVVGREEDPPPGVQIVQAPLYRSSIQPGIGGQYDNHERKMVYPRLTYRCSE